MSMKKAVLSIALVFLIVLVVPFELSIAQEQPELEQGGWNRPTIDDVELEIKNITGMFKLNLNAMGSAPEGTNRLEVTFGTLNGTKIEANEGVWFEEGTVFLFIYGSTLQKEEGPYEWSNWSFNVWFSMSSTGGIEGAASQLGDMFGVETGNTSMEDLDLMNLTALLQENRFYFIARSYNETGEWGQEAFDITDHVSTALLQFIIDEGLIENPFSDDDDEFPTEEDEVKEKVSVSPLILVGIFVVGIVALLIMVVVVIFGAISSKRKSQ